MTAHRVETDRAADGYYAWCLGCDYSSAHPTLSDAVRAGNDHLDDTKEPGSE